MEFSKLCVVQLSQDAAICSAQITHNGNPVDDADVYVVSCGHEYNVPMLYPSLHYYRKNGVANEFPGSTGAATEFYFVAYHSTYGQCNGQYNTAGPDNNPPVYNSAPSGC